MKNRKSTFFIGLCIGLLAGLQGHAQDCRSLFCNPFKGFGCPDRYWIDADYLYWNIKNSPEPVPLVATAPNIPHGAPLIGQPGTEVVLGGKSIKNSWRSGGRFAIGCWFNGACCYGAEASYFFLPNGSKSDSVASSGAVGSPFLAVPFFNTNTDSESSSPVATPGQFAGFAKLKVVNRMQGAEVNGLKIFCSDCAFTIHGLAGFRYWNFDERLTFFVDSPALAIPEEVYLVKDAFHTENNFYGGQIGVGVDYFCNRFIFNVKGKLALGAMCEESIIKGKFLCNDFNGLTSVQTFAGGYFGLPSNIGHYKQTCFAVIPEVNLNFGYQVMECLRLQVGYTFLYVNNMLWAGKQMNRNINPTQSALYEFTPTPTLVGQPKPKASFKTDSLWAQGLNVGVILQF